MKIIKCKICGHEIKADDNEEYVRCESCGSYNEVSIKIPLGTLRCIRCNTPLDLKKVKDGVLECSHCHQVMTFPKDNQADNVISVIKRGKECLDISNFDEAYNLFTKAIELDPSEPEGYFNRALARFKVQYLRDLVNRRMQPICHAIRDNMFSEDSDYKKSLELAKDTQKREYQRKANEIDEIKREFSKLEAQGIDYDCFICVKIADDYQNKTEDYYQANDIYYKLKDNKIEPFFSERILANYSGEAYEAHILYALYKAKCMLLICSDEKYLDTPWVKNEYTRFKSLIDAKEKEEGSLCIVFYKNIIERIPTIKEKIQGIKWNDQSAMLNIVNYAKRFCEKQNIDLLNTKDKAERENTTEEMLKNINLLILRNKKTDAIDLLFDALANDYSCYELWDKLFDLYSKEYGYKDLLENLYHGALGALNEEDRIKFENKYSSYVIKDKKITSNNFTKPIDQKELIKKVEVNTLEEYKQKVIEGYIDIEYPDDIEEQIIEFLRQNKDTNENILCQYGAFVLTDKIKTNDDYKEAFEIMSKLANKKNIMAQSYLGDCYYKAKGVRPDYSQAFNWYKKAAEQGYANAQYNLVNCYYFGKGVKQDYGQALYWCKKSAEQNYARAQDVLGNCYYYGRGIKQDFNQAVYWYKKAAEQENSKAQYNLANCYYNGEGVEKNYVQAVYWLKKSAELGNAIAQNHLGLCYESGEGGVDEDGCQAVFWYKRAAEQGNANAQYNLVNCYYFGYGVKQDYSQALYWCKKSAEQGNEDAQEMLHLCYDMCQDADENKSKDKYGNEIYDKYKKLADQGDEFTQWYLGMCYFYGEGVEQNYIQAVYWYKKSAEQGYDRAQYELGSCYELGQGVKQDDAQAIHWYKKAAKQGNVEATKRLKFLAGKKTLISKEYLKKVTVNTIEEYKQKVIDGYIFIEYSNDIEEEIIEFLESNKDTNENILCQYGAFVLDDKIKTNDDYKEAFEIMSKLANKNNVMAQNYLGDCYYKVKGVRQDYTQAFYWYKKSAEQGYAGAQCNLGNCYYYGRGVKQDYVQAVYWFKKSVEQGDIFSLCKLGDCYYYGRGVKQDNDQAFNWYKKSAEQGCDAGQYNLGICYYNGIGVKQNLDKAKYWYTKATENGNENAKKTLDNL